MHAEPDIRALLRDSLTQIRSLRAELAEREQGLRAPLAIIGASCRFPAGADSLDAFARGLRAGVDAVTIVPADRWNADALYDPDSAAPGKIVSREGAFLAGIDQFDPEFFGIAPREAEHLDPQQRLLLEVAWEALENAALAPERLRGSRTGVFIGLMSTDYIVRALRENGYAGIDAYSGTGGTLSAAAGRLAYFFGFQGPTMAVDTACSSSLVAVHLACQSLRTGECDLALAGGVNALLTPEPSINLSRARMISPRGRCRTFDASADGYVRGEGCGVILLKRLDRARLDGDRVLGLIRGSAVNQDGRSSGLTAPNGQAQQALLRAALAAAAVRPEEIGYVECHGSATPLGDPIEVHAIRDVLGRGRPDDRPLALGSVKTNFGHLEGAAGICGLLKALLVVQGGEVFPHLHLERLNPHIDLGGVPIVIPTHPMPWFTNGGPRLAGVNSFGFVGTNAHVIVGSAPQEDTKESPGNRTQAAACGKLLPLSARSESALRELARRYAGWFEERPQVDLTSVARTLSLGRSHFECRAALTLSSKEDAALGFGTLASGKTTTGVARGCARAHARRQVAFLFTGQGAQHPGMGRKLLQSEPVFRDAFLRCEEALRPYFASPLTELLLAGGNGVLDETAVAQPALFALEYALAELWISWGVRPNFVLGHSLGEFAAACVAGILSFEDALRLVAERGRLTQALSPEGAMAAVLASEADVRSLLAGREDRLAIAALNGPRETVLSGTRVEIESVLADLARAGVAARKLAASHAFHSPLMRPVLAEFERVLKTVAFSPPALPVVANVSGALDAAQAMTRPEYWLEQLIASVRLGEAMTALAAAGASVFLEIGPRPVLAMLGPKILPDPALTWLPSLRGPREDGMTPSRSLAELYVLGVEVNWEAIHSPPTGSKLALPTYPFQRRRFWLSPAVPPLAAAVSGEARREGAAPACPISGECGVATRRAAVTALNMTTGQFRFSVMFFAATQDPMDGDKYRLVLEAARFADRHGFASVWVPERHFTDMGSLYPNAAVLHAALARETRHVRLMAGSVVAPLHHPIRIAEEWAMVDNLSGGRIGLSFASGWNPDDFAFFPERYAGRRECAFETLATVRRLWRGEKVEVTSGTGRRTRVGIFPTPLQKELPFWITAAANPETFRKAGEFGANLLTHLLDQDVEGLEAKIRLYREARARNGHDPAAGCVTVMVHTFVGPELAPVREAVRVPFCNYLKANRNLLAGLAHSRGRQVDVSVLSERDLDDLVNFLYERFASRRALFGTPVSCEPLVRQLAAAGVNELASLLDFGPTADEVLGSLPWLSMLKQQVEAPTVRAPVAATAGMGLGRGTERELPSDWFYELEWRVLPSVAPVAASARGRWLIFADSGGFGDRLAAALEADRCVLIRRGTPPAGAGVSAHEFRVEQTGSNNLARFFSEYAPVLAASPEIAGVVFLWPLDAPPTAELTAESLRTSQSLVAEGARQVVRGLVTAAPHRAIPVWWVTRGAVRAAAANHSLMLAQAPLWGFARGVNQEHPELRSGLVDLDPLGSDEVNAALLAAHVQATPSEDKVAFRGGTRWGERLVRLKPPASARQRWECRPDAGYLVTGGLGGVGLKVAEWLVERGARHLLLAGRSSPGQAAQSAIASLQGRGAAVVTAAADVAQGDSLKAALETWRAAGAPSICGVIHAAGSWHDVPVSEMDSAMLAEVLAPKVAGTWVLERTLAEQGLDFFVSFSSLSALLPAHGQTNYAAANAFLDAHAQWRRAAGRHALSIDWGPWADVGFGATERGLRAHQRLESFGLHRLSPADALDALGLLLARDVGRAVVARMDWAMLACVDAPLARTPFLSELSNGVAQQAPATPALTDGLAHRLELAPSPEHPELVRDRVAAIVAQVLHLPRTELRIDEPLPNLGLDSLMAVEIKNRVQAEVGVNVPLACFLEGLSAATLASRVHAEMKASRPGGAQEPASEAAMEEFAI